MSPGKKSNPKAKAGKSVPSKISENRVPRRSTLSFVEKQPCCEWCWCSEGPSVTETELRALLQEGSRQRGGSSPSKVKPTGPLKYVHARDGCAESGYFTRRAKPSSGNTMEKLRKSCKATQDLPPPHAAIEKSKYRQAIRKKKLGKIKKGTKEETKMTEINMLLKRRLSGSISMFEDDAGERDEALLSGKLMSQDVAPFLLSSLVNEAETGRMRSSFSEGIGERRRSSFSRRSIDLTVERTLYDNQDYGRLEHSSDIEFIDQLPTLSKLVKQELEKDLAFTQRYVKVLERLAKSDINEKKVIKKQERWMVLFYTTSEESDNIVHFSCMLVRLILQHHCVAYEERDVALAKKSYKRELQAKLEKEEITVPYVFAKGVAIGDSRVIYAIHKMKLMKIIFKDFMMSHDLYIQWLGNSLNNKVALSIDVKLNKYPALRSLVGKSTRVYLSYQEDRKVEQGKDIIKSARSKWQTISKESFVQPDYLIFVKLKTTIMLIYTIINNIYLAHTSSKL